MTHLCVVDGCGRDARFDVHINLLDGSSVSGGEWEETLDMHLCAEHYDEWSLVYPATREERKKWN